MTEGTDASVQKLAAGDPLPDWVVPAGPHGLRLRLEGACGP